MLFQFLLLPTRASLRAFSVASQALLKTISRVAGAEIVNDAVAFFQAFQGMEEGFHDRAAAVRALLADPTTAYVLVTSPREDAVKEAAYFAEKLGDSEIRPAGVVVNRVHPRFGPADLAPPPAVEGEGGEALAVLAQNLAELDEVADREERVVARLAAQVDRPALARIPLLDEDVHDLDGLAVVAKYMFGVG